MWGWELSLEKKFWSSDKKMRSTPLGLIDQASPPSGRVRAESEEAPVRVP